MTKRMSKGKASLALLFAATLFVSAFLLFWIQPLIAKMLLPSLGGSPAVWNTCMLFFQGMLLAGYGYVLIATKWLSARQQLLLHLSLLLLAALSLPVVVSSATTASVPPEGNPAFWLLSSLLKTLCLPFFVISATAPLLQKWFSATRHPSAHDPYFLYAASNAGSFIALITFPLLLEPDLSLREQSGLWTAIYGALVLLMIACAAVIWKASSSAAPGDVKVNASGENQEAEESDGPVTLRRRLRWVLLAFVPSSLVLGVTTYITTDIASAPLFWVIPLALYLLSFVFVFAQRQILPRRLMASLLPVAAVTITLIFVLHFTEPIWFFIPVHLIFFFTAAMVCHGQLADDRPNPNHLAEFYLWIAVGGVLGGIFNALVAPLIFNVLLEYPLVVVLACFLLPHIKGKERSNRNPLGRTMDAVLPLGIMLLTAGAAWLIDWWRVRGSGRALALLTVAVLVTLASRRLTASRPAQFALALGIVMLGGIILNEVTNRTIYRARNFYGTLRVARDAAGLYHVLNHGTTLHGRQLLDPIRRCEPLSYYHQTGPLGGIFAAFNKHPASPNVAVVGLGTGSAVAYSRSDQKWTFYEINPAVPVIANDQKLFTYLQSCSAAPVEIVMGDARRQLEKAPPGDYGLIVLDAFSSDAIPIHLMTREAMALYLSKLKDGGLLAIHISNRHLTLAPVVGDIAKDVGLVGLHWDERIAGERGKNPSNWVVVARRRDDLGDLVNVVQWQALEGRSRPQIWTDDFSNIVSVLSWN